MFGKGSTVPTLYNISLHSFVKWKHFGSELLKDLPGFVKEDVLNIFRGKYKEHQDIKISDFLHPTIRKLDTGECEVTCKELEDISKCTQIQLLEMNPKRYHRFNHPSCALECLVSSLQNLIKLHIQRNEGVTDSVVQLLVLNCSRLQELDVAGCRNLTDCSMILLSTLPYMRILNLSDTLVGDEGLVAISKGLSSKSLKELKLNNCTNVSDKGINSIVEECKQLWILLFSGCSKVTVDCQLFTFNSFLGRDTSSKVITYTYYCD